MGAVTLQRACGATTVTYDTFPYFETASITLGPYGRGPFTTVGETFLAPSGSDVKLNDFTFFAEANRVGPIANLYLRAFVYRWSNLAQGGPRPVGDPIYMSQSFLFVPPSSPQWGRMTFDFGADGLALTPGDRYVMGFTLSNPDDYAASMGTLGVKMGVVHGIYYPTSSIPPGVDFGSGSAVTLINSNNFAALNTTPWAVWDSAEQTDAMTFTAHFTVVPETSMLLFVPVVASFLMSSRIRPAAWRRGLELKLLYAGPRALTTSEKRELLLSADSIRRLRPEMAAKESRAATEPQPASV